MAEFLSDGTDEMLRLLDNLANVPEELQAEILQEQAKVVTSKVREYMIAFGVKRTGDTLRAMRTLKPKRDKNGNMTGIVTFVGKNKKGVRYGEIAFINNYGSSRQEARLFYTNGVIAAEKKAFEIAEKKYNAWVESQKKERMIDFAEF